MTLNDKLESFFRSRPNKWLRMQRIAEVAGTGGFRNRITDLRLQRKLKIENRKFKKNGYTVSEYRFTA